MRFLTFLLTVATVCLWGSSVTAGDLTYEAAPECPERAVAHARIGQGRTAHVTIQRKGGVLSADVTLGDGDERLTRHLEGEKCEGILDALAVVFALDRQVQQPKSVEQSTPPIVASPSPVDVSPEPPSESSVPSRHRSAIELGLGVGSGMRSLQSKTMWGFVAYAEIAAPELGASWYRPTMRLSAATWGSGIFFDSTLADPTNTAFTGGSFDACPVGVALVSTRRIDLIASICAVLNLGSAKRNGSSLWADGGALGRAALQIGSKRQFRGFISIDGGAVSRLGKPVIDPPSSETTPTDVVFRSNPNAAMFTTSISGGLLLP